MLSLHYYCTVEHEYVNRPTRNTNGNSLLRMRRCAAFRTNASAYSEKAAGLEAPTHLFDISSLLLDAVDIAVPGQPTLMHYLRHDPVPIHYTTVNVPAYPELTPVPPQTVEPVDPGRPQPVLQTNGTNGHL